MSEGERKIADARGQFVRVVRHGRRLPDADWTSGRLVLSNERLVLVDNDGTRTVPLSDVARLDGRYDVGRFVASVSGYVSLYLSGEDVLLVAPDDDAFETAIYRALLDRTVVLARHPAVEGGVVQDTEWLKARVKVEAEALAVAMADGSFVEVALDDVGSLDRTERTVRDGKRPVLETEHTEGGASVQTYLSGEDRHVAFLESFLRNGEEGSEIDVELSSGETEVLLALYSGVSPFEIPGFVGGDVDEVEATFERLVDLGVLEEVRKRREVVLNARGRNIASTAMNDQ
ncbi:CheF family chemotaxis protein [Haloplanus sp. GCM10025708]|uniref:CheF family chemotaxis protein n=1 Tax=Haloferacaceae TaxID=1644056 RepID=UPI003621BE14